jgi:hypothetical protein
MYQTTAGTVLLDSSSWEARSCYSDIGKCAIWGLCPTNCLMLRERTEWIQTLMCDYVFAHTHIHMFMYLYVDSNYRDGNGALCLGEKRWETPKSTAEDQGNLRENLSSWYFLFYYFPKTLRKLCIVFQGFVYLSFFLFSTVGVHNSIKSNTKYSVLL